ncbi:UNVERIFIED_CONTAM: hypothetical protein K2H54_024764 [Gekko kuhli]
MEDENKIATGNCCSLMSLCRHTFPPSCPAPTWPTVQKKKKKWELAVAHQELRKRGPQLSENMMHLAGIPRMCWLQKVQSAPILELFTRKQNVYGQPRQVQS